MPDPARKTISATQAAALFGASPYVTTWMLWHWFKSDVPIDNPESSRMSWGKKMQPLLLQQAAEDLKLRVEPNADDDYVTRGIFGCTRDADIFMPDRGFGALETKCVFDYGVWMRDWDGGKSVPRMHEIQLQQQMMVGRDGKPFEWGVIAAWVCGDMHYFERAPLPELWQEAEGRGGEFMESLKGEPPSPFGTPVEVPLLAKLFQPEPESILDLTARDDAIKIAEMVRMLDYHREEAAGNTRGAEDIRAKLIAMAGQNEKVILPHGINYKLRKGKKSLTLTTYVPDDIPIGNFGGI